MWVFIWVFMYDFCEKDWSHTLHLCGFLPLWIFMWLFRYACIVKHLEQTEHSNGLSSVFFHSSSIRSLSIGKQCLQTSDPHFGLQWIESLLRLQCSIQLSFVFSCCDCTLTLTLTLACDFLLPAKKESYSEKIHYIRLLYWYNKTLYKWTIYCTESMWSI